MPEDLESILRKSLDEVDRNNKRMKRTSVVLVGAMGAWLLTLSFLIPFSNIDVRWFILWAAGILFFGEIALHFQTRMTVSGSIGRVLKAIELLSKQ
jgi:hypothetical protein